jgi:hypothetical protein
LEDEHQHRQQIIFAGNKPCGFDPSSDQYLFNPTAFANQDTKTELNAQMSKYLPDAPPDFCATQH